MHIPILGWLFKNTDTNRTKNELLIFLTPRIIAEQEDSTKKL
jgi:type II secretory pathway component GspD/PulD (secretin)